MTRQSMTAALAGCALLMAGGAASAVPMRFDPALKTSSPLLTDVQFRGGGHGLRMHGGFGHGGFRHGFGHRGGFGRHGFGGGGFRHGGFGYRHGFGYHRGFGAGVAGLAAGAALGATLAPGYGYGGPAYGYQPAPVVGPADAAAYCESRFKSYNPATGTYTGYDGLKHPCP